MCRVRNVVAPELFGCSRGLHDTPVAPLPVLTQVFKAFTVGSQSPLPYKAGWRKEHPQAVEGSVSLMGIEAEARKQWPSLPALRPFPWPVPGTG